MARVRRAALSYVKRRSKNLGQIHHEDRAAARIIIRGRAGIPFLAWRRPEIRRSWKEASELEEMAVGRHAERGLVGAARCVSYLVLTAPFIRSRSVKGGRAMKRLLRRTMFCLAPAT